LRGFLAIRASKEMQKIWEKEKEKLLFMGMQGIGVIIKQDEEAE